MLNRVLRLRVAGAGPAGTPAANAKAGPMERRIARLEKKLDRVEQLLKQLLDEGWPARGADQREDWRTGRPERHGTSDRPAVSFAPSRTWDRLQKRTVRAARGEAPE